LVTKLDLEAVLDCVALRMTVRFEVILVAGLGGTRGDPRPRLIAQPAITPAN
jgi:hypothetical protein